MPVDYATDQIALEILDDPTKTVNLLANPDSRLPYPEFPHDRSGWGWVTPEPGPSIQHSGPVWPDYALRYMVPFNQGGDTWFHSEDVAITAGNYCRGLLEVLPGLENWAGSIGLEFIDNTGAVIHSSATTPWGIPATATTTRTGVFQAPAGTVAARVRVDVGNGTETGGFEFRAGLIETTTPAEADTVTTIPPKNDNWVPILDPTAEISIVRNELNVATLTAQLFSATLDPAVNDLIRPGREIRLTDGTLSLLFTGRLDDGTTVYAPLADTPDRRAAITLVATDPAALLANASAPATVNSVLTDLSQALEGAGVPWSLNNLTYEINTVTNPVTNVNENASALDQVAIIRDSYHGYAWVTRSGLLIVADPDHKGHAENHVTLTESEYSDLQLGFNLDGVINDVVIDNLIMADDGKSITQPHGPYSDLKSFQEWGRRSAKFTISDPTATAATMRAYAETVFAANATPVKRASKVIVPIRSTVPTGVRRLNLYDRATISNTATGYDADHYITSIRHHITPGKWLMTLGFSDTGQVAAPTRAAAPARDVEHTIIDSGHVTVSASGGSGSASVNFAADFAAAPVILLTTQAGGWIADVDSPTKNGVGVSVVHRTGNGSGNVSVHWLAIGPAAT